MNATIIPVAHRALPSKPTAFPTRLLALGTGCLLILSGASSAHANVYATNIRIQGSVSNTATGATVFLPCNTVRISYLLNEPADAGVVVEILSGANVLWTKAIAGGSPGTLRGMNSLIWGGTNNSGISVPLTNDSVRITAASVGYGEWTQITDDFNAGNYAYQPRGIAVNRNTNSPYYGRVFVSSPWPETAVFLK